MLIPEYVRMLRTDLELHKVQIMKNQLLRKNQTYTLWIENNPEFGNELVNFINNREKDTYHFYPRYVQRLVRRCIRCCLRIGSCPNTRCDHATRKAIKRLASIQGYKSRTTLPEMNS